jgi:hypothetical protein
MVKCGVLFEVRTEFINIASSSKGLHQQTVASYELGRAWDQIKAQKPVSTAESFRGLSRSLQSITGIAPLIMSVLVRSTCVTLSNSLIFLPFDSTQSELLTAFLNKPLIYV